MNPKDLSISRKLTWMNMMVCGVALLTACAAFIGYDSLTFKAAKMRSLSIRAQLVGLNFVSPLLLGDPKSSEKIFAPLKSDPDIVSVVVYQPTGQRFASYSRGDDAKAPDLLPMPWAEPDTHSFSFNSIVLQHSIVSDEKLLGTVYIRSDAAALKKRFRLYVEISLVVSLASLLAGLAVSTVIKRSIARPICELADVAKMVAREKVYSHRVDPAIGHGEVGTLIEAFNEMMDHIQQSEAALQTAHDELEKRVEERTAELVKARVELEAYSKSILRAKEDVERASGFKDQFLSTMSHELRTPLNAVLGFSELLADVRYGPLNERQRRYINHIHVSGQHLLQLINDILDLSRIEAGRLQLTIESVRVGVAFSEVAGALMPLVDKKSHRLLHFASPDLVVKADQTRFKQMLMNLVGNAIKFTPEGGTIELSACRVEDSIRIEVRDSGPGIPPSEKHRIFEAFHRMKQNDKAAEGTGLGLAITRSLVELHGGQLGLESEPGAGSCFYFTLPAATTHRRKTDCKAELEPSSGEPLKILVIEDDPAASDLLESQLASEGYEAIVCNQPQLALETAAELLPAAITLDIVMMPLSGWDLLAALKADTRTAKIPVVVVTILDQRETAALLGADDYIVKPVDRNILLGAMERCLNSRGDGEETRTILVVEDDVATAEFISEAVSSRGYAVRTVSDGEQARAQVTASLPHLVILDLILPKVSGFELIASWRSNPRTADIPVFVLTDKELTPEEKDYLHANTEATFSKREQWLDAFVKQVRRVAPLESEVKL